MKLLDNFRRFLHLTQVKTLFFPLFTFIEIVEIFLMKNIFLLIILSLLNMTGIAQSLSSELFSTFGGESKSDYIQMLYSGGEPITSTVRNGNFVFTQGFLQGEDPIISSTKENREDDKFVVYPNPATDFIVVKTTLYDRDSKSVRLVNLLGATVINRSLLSEEARIDLKNIARGPYLLSLQNGGRNVKTCKIIIK